MADNISQAQHITELDFDLTKALNDLKQIENEVEETAKRIANTDFKVGDVVYNSGEYEKQIKQYENFTNQRMAKENEVNKKIKKDLEDLLHLNNKIHNLNAKSRESIEPEFQEHKKIINALTKESDELVNQAKLQKVLSNEQKQQYQNLKRLYEIENNLYVKSTTKAKSNSAIEQKKEEVKLGKELAKQIDYTIKQEEKRSKYVSKMLKEQWEERVKLEDAHHSSIANAIDFEIEKQKKAGEQYAQMLKSQMEAEVDAEKQKQKYTDKAYTLNEKLYSLAQKGKNMSDKSYVGEQKKVKQLQEQSDELLKQLKLSNSLTDEQKQQLDLLAKQTREQENIYKKASTQQGSAVKSSLLDDAKRYISYKAVDLGVTAVREGFQEVRDVETRMMEIARVMNLTSEQTVEMRNNLYALGKEYGRSFEEVSDIALRFTQAGYEANDVMSMTRAMLLGINTAELEAESGTVALIGIMQQWEYEASQLTTIIDKLNYTADNNAITTQDLTDALLNASSVAKIAGMSFEDTMGVLVAMKEASGRTGKEVGNAFKSILSYIQRESSLNIFEQAGIDVYVNETTKELRPMMDILSDMATRWGSMGDEAVDALVKSADEAQLFSEEMAAVMGVEKEYEQALRDVNDAETRGVTSAAAGVFRRNYYIALMEKFAKVSQVSAEAIDTEGYSLRENERYMETTDAKIKQLTSSLSELAVAFADAGALDLAKEFLDSATAITEFAKQAGGLESAIFTLLGVFLMLKGQKIAQGITEIENAVNSMFKAFETGAITTQSAFGLIGLSISAIAVIFSTIDYAAKAGQRAIEDFTKSTQEYANTKSELEKVKLELDAIAKSIEEIQGKGELDFTDETQLEKLRQQRQELEHQQKLLEIQEKQLAKQNAETAIVAYETNQQSFTINGGDSRTNLLTEYQNKIEKYEAEREVLLRDIENAKRNNESEEIISALEYDYQSANELVEHYKGLVVDEEGYIASAVIDIEQYMAALEEAGMQGTDTYRQMELQKIALDNALKQDNTPAINSYEDYVKAVANGDVTLKSYIKSTEESTKATEENVDVLTEQANAITITAENLSDYSSKIGTLNGYIDKLSNGQKLSADETLKLIELYPELAKQIVTTADGFQIEIEKLGELNQANIDAVVQYKLAQTELTKILSEESLKRLEQYKGEALAVATFADVARIYKDVQGKGGVGGYSVNSAADAEQLNNILDIYKQEVKGIEDLFNNVYKNTSSQERDYSKTNTSLEETKSILDELLKDFNNLNDIGLLEVTEQIEYLNYVLKDTRLSTDDVTKVQKQLIDLYKEEITDIVELEKDAISERINAIEDAYDKEISEAETAYDRKMSLIDKEKEALSQKRSDEDYESNISDLYEELRNLEYDNEMENISPAEYLKQREELLNKIDDLELKHERELEDRELEERQAAAEKQKEDAIKALEKQKQEEIEIQEEKLKEIEEMFEETNLNLIATSGVYAPEIYNAFKTYFTNPLKQDIEEVRQMIASLQSVKVSVSMGTSMSGFVGASTGGETKSDGLVMLHNNEFVANSAITDGLRELVVNREILDGIKKLATSATYAGVSTVVNNDNASKSVNVTVYQNFTQTQSSEVAANKANRKLAQEIAKAVN